MVGKKLFVVLGMILCMCFTNSCGRTLIYSDSGEIITKVGEAIVQDFIEGDFEGIKEYLSPKALETSDLYEGFSYDAFVDEPLKEYVVINLIEG